MNRLTSHYIGTGVFARTESAAADEGTGSLTVGHIGSGVWLAAPFARGERATPAQLRNPLRRRLEEDWLPNGVWARTVKNGQRLEDHCLRGVWAIRRGQTRIQTERAIVCSVRSSVSTERQLLVAIKSLVLSDKSIAVSVRSLTETSLIVRVTVRKSVDAVLREIVTSVRKEVPQDIGVLVSVRGHTLTEMQTISGCRSIVQTSRVIEIQVRQPVATDRSVLTSVRSVSATEVTALLKVLALTTTDREIICRVLPVLPETDGSGLAYAVPAGQGTSSSGGNGESTSLAGKNLKTSL